MNAKKNLDSFEEEGTRRRDGQEKEEAVGWVIGGTSFHHLLKVLFSLIAVIA